MLPQRRCWPVDRPTSLRHLERRAWIGQRAGHLMAHLSEKLARLEVRRRQQVGHGIDRREANAAFLSRFVQIRYLPVDRPFLHEGEQSIIVLTSGHPVLENIK